MFRDPWKEQVGETLRMDYSALGRSGCLRFGSDFAYYLCYGNGGLVVRDDYADGLKPVIVGVLSVKTQTPKHMKSGHLIPLDNRFSVDRTKGLLIVNSQVYFDLSEPVSVLDRAENKSIDFVVRKC